MKKILCLDTDNQINFYKKKISTARVEPREPIALFSAWLRLLELVFSFYVN